MTIMNPYGTNAPNPSVELRILNDTAMIPLASNIQDPKWIALIPVFAPKGETNKAKLYRSGQGAQLMRDYGRPNIIKDGIAMDMAQMILSKNDTGVLLVNLRGADATSAVAFKTVKYKVQPNVPKNNDQGQPLYRTPEGVTTTVSTGNTAITIDVVTLKYEVVSSAGVKDLKTARTALNALYTSTADAQGFKTIPIGAFFYRGNVAYGNNVTLRIADILDPVTKSVLFNVDVFNGESLERIASPMGFNPEDSIGTTSMFFENVINKADTCISAVASNYIDDYIKIVKDALALDDKLITKFNYLGGAGCQSLKFDPASKDLTAANAIVLQNGSDGDLTDKSLLIKSLLRGEIIKDIFNPIRYKIRLLPDIGYAKTSLADIAYFLKERYGTVKAFLTCGDIDTYESALADYVSDFSKTKLDDALLLPGAAAAPRFNEYVRRNVNTAFVYYWLNAWLDKVTAIGNAYDTFAGGSALVAGFETGAITCPTYTQASLVSYYNAKINVPVANTESNVSMYSQLMATSDLSDASELNNSMLFQEITYRVLTLIHGRNYKFAEPKDVDEFKKDIELEITNPLKPYVSSIEAQVYAGVGFDRETMYVEIAVNSRNIAKRFKVSLKYVA